MRVRHKQSGLAKTARQSGAVVHHADEDRGNNKNANLVICEDHTYHMLIHKRKRAYEATGNATSVKCSHCQRWGMTGVGDMRTKANGRSYHKICNAIYEDARRKKGAS